MKEWLSRHWQNRRELAPKLGRDLAVAAVCVAGIVICLSVWNEHYPIRSWLIWRLLPLWGYTLVWVAACVAAGSSILRWLLGDRPLPTVERLVLSMGIGVAAFGSVSYVLGALCLFRTWMAVLLPVLMLAGGYHGLPGLWRDLRAFRVDPRRLSVPWRVATYLAVGWGLVCVVFVYLELLPLPLNYDARWYHLTIAQDYAREGCLVAFPGDNHRAFPHLTSMVHTWGFLVPLPGVVEFKWLLALHLEFAVVLWRILGVAAVAHYLLHEEDTPGIWPVFFLFPSIFIYDQNIGGSADHFLGMFAAPMFLAAARALPRFDWRWGAVTGIVAGGHMLTKYQSVYLVVAVAVVFAARFTYLLGKRLVLRARHRTDAVASLPGIRAMVLGPLAVILVAAAVSSPHFIKNVVYHRNPVYPLATSVFTASTPVHPPGYYEEHPPEGVGPFAPKHPNHFFKRQAWASQELLAYSFHPRNREFSDYRPYMGSLFSLLLPCALFVYRPRRIWLAIAVGYAAFLVWANTNANDRYLLAFYDLFIAVSAALAVRVWQVGWAGRVALVPLVALQLFWGGDAMLHYGKNYLGAAAQLVGRGYEDDSDYQRFAKNRALQRITRATPPDARILSRNFPIVIGLDRTVISDARHEQAYVSYSGLRDANDLWHHLHERGITHLLYPPGERKPNRWNNTVLFGELAHRSGRNSRRFDEYVLLELAAQPPAARVPFIVLTAALPEYPDGLYRVEQLDAEPGCPGCFEPEPEPITALTDENAVDLIDQADAVARGVPLSPSAMAKLWREFRRFDAFGDQALYLRKRPRRD